MIDKFFENFFFKSSIKLEKWGKNEKIINNYRIMKIPIYLKNINSFSKL